ncbi:hypothetical protein BCV70DRAFT_207358 [Testicularia cyperi]|uniref:SNF2 N-terminal domain-containing protein n=1 Tax=Testicularia cyperi TaxID=1882483 RepID=A0A317XLH7_9BASI|nr:hypothetical protein BCV70DRAFT_207358 [Testicularia cyperi]
MAQPIARHCCQSLPLTLSSPVMTLSGMSMARMHIFQMEWFCIVLDKAHLIKGVQTKTTLAVCSLFAERHLCLTGTPVQNSLDDLYPLIRFMRLDPFMEWSTWRTFCGQFCQISMEGASIGAALPIEESNVENIRSILGFLGLRQVKNNYLNLPAKYVREVELQFSNHKREQYQALQHYAYTVFAEQQTQEVKHRGRFISILQEISILQQACDDLSLCAAHKDASGQLQQTGKAAFHQEDAICLLQYQARLNKIL